MITILIDVPSEFKHRAEYVFKTLSSLWGVRVYTEYQCSVSEPIVVYSLPSKPHNAAKVTIPFHPKSYMSSAKYGLVFLNDIPIWCDLEYDIYDFDPIAAIYHLLTFQAEKDIGSDDRDARGIFFTGSLSSQRRSCLDIPLVEYLSNYVFDKISKRVPAVIEQVLPKWPNHKRYAICITHDTDTIFAGSSVELATCLAKLLIRRDMRYFSLLKVGLMCFGKPITSAENIYFGFPAWQALEDKQNIRSAFYIFHRASSIPFALNDCKSFIGTADLDAWNVLKRMSDLGWEFGLHASINAKQSTESLIESKSWIEERLEREIFGIRHHYWAIDWINPYLTFRKHAAAGFIYDSSVAWRDAAGFRAGTCHPYRPFDPEKDAPVDIIELPVAIMDGHIAHLNCAMEKALLIRDAVRAVGGILILNWHTHTTCNMFNCKEANLIFIKLFNLLINDSEAWFTTPQIAAKHWYTKMIDV